MGRRNKYSHDRSVEHAIQHRKVYATRLAARAERVDSGCLEWRGKTYANGYGCFAVLNRYVLAHRLRFMLKLGARLERHELVCHRCDNRICIRFSHLFLGTPKQNTRDMIIKGRDRMYGVKCPRTKLTRESVHEIRIMHVGGVRQKDIALRFGISRSTVYTIVKNIVWKDS